MNRADDAYRAIARHYDATGYGISFRELQAEMGHSANIAEDACLELERDGRIFPRRINSVRAWVPRGYFVTIDGERFIGEAV